MRLLWPYDAPDAELLRISPITLRPTDCIALYCTPFTVKLAYLLTRAGISSYSAVRRDGSGCSIARSAMGRPTASSADQTADIPMQWMSNMATSPWATALENGRF